MGCGKIYLTPGTTAFGNYLLGCDRSGTHQCYQLDLRRGTVDCNPDKLAAVLCWSVSPELYWRLWTTLALIAGVAALSWGNVTKALARGAVLAVPLV